MTYVMKKGTDSDRLTMVILLYIYSPYIAKRPIDFEIKFFQTRSKSQDELLPVDDLRLMLTKF